MHRLVLGLSERDSNSAGAARVMASVCLLLCVSSAAVTVQGSRSERRSDTAIALQTATIEARQAEIFELKQGQVIEREIAGGESHSYRVSLTTGQYLRVVIEQKGTDVVARMFGTDGQKMVEVDNDPTGGIESLSVVAEASGDYRLELQPSNKEAKSGQYAIEIQELREAASTDRIHVVAQKAFEEGNQLRDQQTAQSRVKAIQKYEEALALWRDLGNKRMEAYALNELGTVIGSLGESKKAVVYFDQALILWRDIGDRLNEANALNNGGLEHWRLGDSHKALENYSNALALQRSLGASGGEATTLNNMGIAYSSLGRLQEALESLNQSLPLRRALGDRAGEASALHNIGSIYHNWGEWTKALEYYNQSLPLRRAVGNRQGETATLLVIGALYENTGELSNALKYYEQALELSQATGDRRIEAYVLSNTGSTYRKLGEPQKALDYFNRALTLRRAVEDKFGEAYTLISLGSVSSTLNDRPKALEYYRQALQLSRSVGDRSGEAKALYGLARTQSELGNLLDARTEIEAGLKIIESTRREIVNQQQRAPYLATKKDSYEFYIDLLMRLHQSQPSAGHDAAAFQVSERTRARVLQEILVESRADIRQGIDPVQLEQERSVQKQVSVKAERLTRLLGGKHTEEQEAVSRKEVEAVLSEYQEIEAQIRTKSPRYAGLTQPQPLSLKAIQEQVLDEDTLLLEYALGEERSYVWAVTPTSITSRELPNRAVIETEARRVYGALTARSKTLRFEKPEKRRARIAEADAEYLVAATGLSEMLLTPVIQQLRKKRLLIVCEGALQFVPFGALPLPSPQVKGKRQHTSETSKHLFRPLIADHEIVSLPSVSIVAELRKDSDKRQTEPKTVAVLADPVFQDDDPRVRHQERKATRSDDQSSKLTGGRGLRTELERSAREVGDFTFARLPHTRQEAKDILALTPKGKGRESLDFEASRATANSPDLSQYRIIHFATHALLNSQHPELSGVVLSLVDPEGRPQDGFLRLYEIYNLKLGADLVVLSACRTALGKEIKGEGLVGLTRGFMYAGAPRVVASLWGVEDRTTAELMKSFYSEMLLRRQRPAAALRTAQLHMWREKRLPPYFWAAFVLQGEWK